MDALIESTRERSWPQSRGYRAGVVVDDCMNTALTDHYRCAADSVNFVLGGQLSEDEGYFRFGGSTCYGRSSSGYRAKSADVLLYDVLKDVGTRGSSTVLPIDPINIIDNLRFERYASQYKLSSLSHWKQTLRNAYYYARPLLNVGARRLLQRAHLGGWENLAFPQWPIDTSVENLCEQTLLTCMKARGIDRLPFIWFWPDGAQSCVIMTHDVETEKGKELCTSLMDIDDEFNIKSSIQVVPEGRYEVSDNFLDGIRRRGFEVNIQDLNHDGHLFRDKEEFLRRAQRINQYARAHNARGFRAAVLYRNLDWYSALEFSYDMSVPNIAHLDPQQGGCCTVLPYFVGDVLEIPVTTTQDYMLFHLLGDYSLELWKAQIRGILDKNGLISFIIHPDYIFEKRALRVYRDLLNFLRRSSETEKSWFAIPSDIDRWWRQRSRMQLVKQDSHWKIVGDGCEHASIAFARVTGNGLKYENHSGKLQFNRTV